MAAAPLDGVAGNGTAGDPYEVADASGLFTFAEAANADPAEYAYAHVDVVADIDFSEEQPFPGLDTFSGTLDGLGHTLSGLEYGPSPSSAADLGLIRTLDGGTVRNLTIEGLTVDNGTETGFVAGVAVRAVDATITGNAVVEATLTAANGEKAGGLVAETDGGTLTNNYVHATITANEMPAGIAAYAKGDARIADNLVDADLVMRTPGGPDGTQGNNAGMIIGYPGTPNSGVFTGNVALDGTIDYDGRIDGSVGRILGFTDYGGWTAEENLASTSITISGQPVSGPGTKNQHGTDTDPADLAQVETYEQLGWDFDNAWEFDDTAQHPVPAYSYTLSGSGTEDSPFQIASATDLEFLAEQLNAGNSRYTEAGTYMLTADLDFTDRSAFIGIDSFTAVLDGQGYTITGIEYGPSESSAQLALIRELDGGTVRDLRLDGVRAHSESETESDYAAGVAAVATDAHLDGISITGLDLVAEGAEKAAGIAAELRGSSVVENSWVDGQIVALKMPAGITSYAADSAVVRHNLLTVEVTAITDGAEGTRGINAALVVAYPGNGNDASISGNVAFSGEVTYTGEVAGFAGRILGYYQADGPYRVPDLSNNLAAADIPVAGQPVTGDADGPHGADTDAEQLAEESTYTDLGWDFEEAWRFDEGRGHPIPHFVPEGDRPSRITTTFFGDPQTQRAFTWYSELGENGVVQLAESRDLADARTVSAEPSQNARGELFYQAVATDLAPDTRYHYRVGDAEEGVWSAIGTFVTSDGASDFSFINLTDTQSQNVAEAELSASTMAASLETVPGAEFIVHNGDVVEHGDREQDWIDLLGAAEPTLLSTTIAPASGNHDQATDAFTNHFAVEAPNGQDTSTGAYYSFDYNAAHIAVLNTNEDPAQSVSDEQIDWLRQDVTAARERGAEWILVSMHKGPYTTANHADDADIIAMREALVPLIAELDIDLVLQGHDHVMSRTEVLTHDPDGVAEAAPVATDVITEMINGKRTEYAVSPQGTIYFLPNTAGAKHYQQTTSLGGGMDLESYLQLFDRTGEQGTENFAAIRVEQDRLTVDVYDIRDNGQPRLFESFGIDRQITTVDEQIAALPAPADLTEADGDAVTSARTAVNSLTEAQRSGLAHLDGLEEREAQLRELTGRTDASGAQVAWAAPDAEERQTVTVRNSGRMDLAAMPVRLELRHTPNVAPDALAFTTGSGEHLPYEVESWQPGQGSVVWVRLPELAAESAQTIWAYFGTTAGTPDPARVWTEDYALVEHFAGSAEAGATMTDSTGRQEGEVIGGDIASSVTESGEASARLEGARLQYAGDVGGQHDRISISSVVSLTEEQLAALDDGAPIVAKESADQDGLAAFWQGIRPDGSLGTRLAGNSFEFDPVDLEHSFDFAADGEEHLITQVYDGMTYSVFIDGEQVHAQMVEYRSTYGDPSVPTTIGDLHTTDGEPDSPFTGTISEVQIAGIAFSPAMEQFRYDTLTGEAISYGERTSRSADDALLAVGTPEAGTALEAGLVPVTGTVSHRGQLTATVDGDEVLSTAVDAGDFSVEVPVNALGSQEVQLQLSSEAGQAHASVALEVSDTRAPDAPQVSHEVDPGTGTATLEVQPDSLDRERLFTDIWANATVPLDGGNTVVRTGSTTDRTPGDLTPNSGSVTGELLPTTVGEDENPYQIHQITLTPEQAEQGRVHAAWTGTGDQRRVSAYVWDTAAQEWTLSDTGGSVEGSTVSLDITAEEEAIAADGTVAVLIWRGLVTSPANAEDVTAEPDRLDYSWGLDHVPDTQLYAQATPELMVDQFEYVADRAEERDTRLVVQAGDWVNREYLSQEYQWVGAEPAAQALEDAEVPYLISWGNHDYTDSRNGRVMLPRYFPMERFAESLEGSQWSFGGSQSIDNYYYTGEIDGAPLLVLTVGFFSADQADDAGLAWASEVIADHPDHTVIIANHNSVGAGQNNWSNDAVLDTLVKPYSNVALVLGGHIAGTGVASYEREDGSLAYGILTDYQGRVYGGEEFLRHLSIDAENDLLYANTYSPLLQATSSDGQWHQEIDPEAIPGFHGSDSENFAIELDLGGATERTLTTESFSMSVGEPVQIAEDVTSIGDEPVTVELEGAVPGVEYAWYADLTDEAGHSTRSAVSTLTVPQGPELPQAPTDVAATASGSTVQVSWSAPGGVEVDRYEVTVADRVVTVDGAVLSTVVTDFEPGSYEVTVRAQAAAGWSPSSEPVTVTVTEPDGEGPSDPAQVTVTGDLRPGGEITVWGSSLSAGVEVDVELHSDPVALGQMTADENGEADLTATLPMDTAPGEHRIVLLEEGTEIAAVTILVTGADNGSGGGDGSGGSDGDAAGADDPNEHLTGHLPDTGADVSWLPVALVSILVLLSIGTVLVRRRLHTGGGGRHS
ncbi:MAG TPA: DUF2341 domain-containing protein [Candidatus Ruania gallistercoris]|uniref:DUF2341 domain-containing protein n=1 Tax=Candidatus Ruania gallistercoris TaxID=2838746 RepID=A0A9D2J6H1_9MICO|nr:DUF2341 domain-containing protein [Candidatus Ruania gallistercoris]